MAFHISVRSSAIAALLLAAGCMSGSSTGSKSDFAGNGTDNGSGGGGTGSTQLVTVTNLAGDQQTSSATNISSSLVNAWGIVGYKGMFWIADNATGKVSILDAAGKPATAQSAAGIASDALDLGEGITGVAVNTSNAMQMSNQNSCGPANLIFASTHGTLIGVNTEIKATGGTVLVDRSDVGAVFTGVAVLEVKKDATCTATSPGCDTGMGSGSGSDNSQGSGSGSGSSAGQGSGYGNGQGSGSGAGTSGTGNGSGAGTSGTGNGSGAGTNGNGNGHGTGNVPNPGVLVLAADFHNARIDVFDENFKLVTTPMFSTPAAIPAGFAPFNVMVSGNIVYVAYAQVDRTTGESMAGAGLGFVVAFDVCGNVLWTAKGNELNAPWGMLVIANQGLFGGALLVGNFGDGHITMINPKDGTIAGQLMTSATAAVTIDGLWGLALGTGVQGSLAAGVYFTAGPQDETHGLFGVISAAAQTPPSPPTM
jgi:hypothetical protein